jgi:type IV secretory pathway TraG/TraD family ATPase VirD4
MDLAFTHGLTGLAVDFATMEVPLLVGLVRGRARLGEYFTSPIIAGTLATAAGLGMGALSLLSGIESHGLLRFGVGAVISTVLGYTGGLAAANYSNGGRPHQRGAIVRDESQSRATGEARPFREAEYVSQNALEARRSSRTGDVPQITLAGTAIPIADETKHFKLIGTTGTGKSTAIEEILNVALKRGDRAVIADPDGGYLRRFYDEKRGDIVLNPFDKRSVKWDLFAEIKNSYDVEQLARSLIPDHEGSDRSWRSYARTFFSAVTRQAHESGIDDMAELYRLLVVAEPKELRALVKGTPAQPFLDEQNGRMFDSIRSVTSSAVGALDYISQQEAARFSVKQWVRDESPGVLFIPYKAGQIASLRSTISAWMRLAIFETMDQDETPDEREGQGARRLWFVVDELDALGQIDGLKDALARLRKFGGRCVLGFQAISQVDSTYGKQEANTIIENCANTLILRCSSSEGGGTARFASQLIGDREIKRTTVSRSSRATELVGSVSHSEHYALEPAVLPSQIEQLPDLSGYLKHASSPEWQRVRLNAVRRWESVRPEREAGTGRDSTAAQERGYGRE